MQIASVANAAEFPEPGSAGDYNLLPYLSVPYAYTQPAHLAAIATLFGLDAPNPTRARVLEIGCASGGNIIPLAVRFPDAHFFGVDLAQRHIDDGKRRIAALSLTNIELHQGDLAHLSLVGEQFDYVLCHGVFSWVPQHTQDAIFRVCQNTLATNGLAAISYNVLPGWHMRRVVRDLCLYHVGSEGLPREKVAAARQVIKDIAETTTDKGPYGELLRSEAKRIAHRPAAYILGEFLAANNVPSYFHKFVEHAGRFGLGYVCEGDFNSSVPELLVPTIRQRNKALAGSDPLALEQYVDFCTGRTFRRSVLVRTAQAASAKRDRNMERLRTLHFASRLRFDVAGSNNRVSVYRDDRGHAIRAKARSTNRALCRLAESYPMTLPFEQLINIDDQPQGRSSAEAHVSKLLFAMVVAGQATVSVLPLYAGRADTTRPKAWSLARREAATGQRWVTNLQHNPVALQPIPAALLPLMDGSRDRTGLLQLLASAFARGSIPVPGLSSARSDVQNASLESLASQYVESTINYLAQHALLEA